MPYSCKAVLKGIEPEAERPLSLVMRHDFSQSAKSENSPGGEAQAGEKSPEEQIAEMLELARLQSQEIINDATARAAQIVEDTRVKAEHDARQMAMSAKEQGYQEGYNQALETAGAEADKLRQEARQVLYQSREIQRRTLENMELYLVDLAREIAEKMVSVQLVLNPEIVVSIAREVLTLAKGSEWVTIYVNPQDAPHHEVNKETYLRVLPPKTNINIIPDDGIRPGGCRVETENGELDATLDTRWKQLFKILQGGEE